MCTPSRGAGSPSPEPHTIASSSGSSPVKLAEPRTVTHTSPFPSTAMPPVMPSSGRRSIAFVSGSIRANGRLQIAPDPHPARSDHDRRRPVGDAVGVLVGLKGSARRARSDGRGRGSRSSPRRRCRRPRRRSATRPGSDRPPRSVSASIRIDGIAELVRRPRSPRPPRSPPPGPAERALAIASSSVRDHGRLGAIRSSGSYLSTRSRSASASQIESNATTIAFALSDGKATSTESSAGSTLTTCVPLWLPKPF